MQGITNAPQGGSGGEWTLRTPNNDWTDLFDISGNIKAKKNMFIVASNISMSCFIPKNYEGTTSIYLYSPVSSGLGTSGGTSGGNISTVMRVAISKTNVPSSSATFATRGYGYTFTFDGSSLTVTANSSIGTSTINKSAFTIYVSD